MVKKRKKNRKNSHLIIHCLTSEEVSGASEQANERTEERAAQYCSLDSWLFWTILSWNIDRWPELSSVHISSVVNLFIDCYFVKREGE